MNKNDDEVLKMNDYMAMIYLKAHFTKNVYENKYQEIKMKTK